MSYLAVKKQVSASSQNQAFNGLLLLYRHVLGQEFGAVEGVVRVTLELLPKGGWMKNGSTYK